MDSCINDTIAGFGGEEEDGVFLPSELWCTIVSMTGFTCKIRLRGVCKSFKDLIDGDLLFAETKDIIRSESPYREDIERLVHRAWEHRDMSIIKCLLKNQDWRYGSTVFMVFHLQWYDAMHYVLDVTSEGIPLYEIGTLYKIPSWDLWTKAIDKNLFPDWLNVTLRWINDEKFKDEIIGYWNRNRKCQVPLPLTPRELKNVIARGTPIPEENVYAALLTLSVADIYSAFAFDFFSSCEYAFIIFAHAGRWDVIEMFSLGGSSCACFPTHTCWPEIICKYEQNNMDQFPRLYRSIPILDKLKSLHTRWAERMLSMLSSQ